MSLREIVETLALTVQPIAENEGKCGVVKRRNEAVRARTRIEAREKIKEHLFNVDDGIVVKLK